MNNYNGTKTKMTTELFNYSDFSYNNTKNFGTRELYVDLATKFLGEYKEKRKYRVRNSKKLTEKETIVYTDQKNPECIFKLITQKNKIATINYLHLINYIEEYYVKTVKIAEKQGHDQNTSLIDLDECDYDEKKVFDTYFGLKHLLKYLEGNRPYFFCDIFKEAVINVIRDQYKDIRLPQFNRIELLQQQIQSEEDQEEETIVDQNQRDLSAFENKTEFDDLHISIKNYDGNEVEISSINSSHVSTLGSIKGQLTSYDDSNRIHVKTSYWTCQNIKCRYICPVAGSKPPTKCFNCGEKVGFVEEESLSETVDFIYIKLQQKNENEKNQTGFSFAIVKIQGRHLINYFREKMKPTSVMSVTGVFELARNGIDGSSRSSGSDDKIAILNALTIEFEDANKSLEYNDRYWEITKKINPDYIEAHRLKCIRSVATHVYGFDAIKQAILLLCLGAEPIKRLDGSRVKGDINVLIAGDSGMAKSEFGIWLLHVLTSSIRTVGGSSSGTTKVGLTAMIDNVNGVKHVVLGVMALCDMIAAAIIDELDKRTKEDFETLASPMDDNQRIELHKGGHHVSLPARCPVLLIGNANSSKNGGKWDPTKTIGEQTNYAAWLLSRIDLAFIVYDNGDPEYHKNMLEHIKKSDTTSVHEYEYESNQKNKNYSEAMFEKLEQDILNNNFEGVYDIEFMRHEIQYLKQNYKPKLIPNSDAYNLLEEEWFKLKQMVVPEDIGDGKIINNSIMDPRKLNALKRLACAEARLRRHHVVTREDAESAKHVMLASVASLLPITKAPGTEKLDGNTSPIELLNKYLSDDKNKDKRTNNIVKEFTRFRDNILREYKAKFKKFNHILTGLGVERCPDCKGKGEYMEMNSSGIMDAKVCVNCKGKKGFPRSFTYNDLEHLVVNVQRIFPKGMCAEYFKAYIQSEVLYYYTNSSIRLNYDLDDSVLADTLVEKLAMNIATELTNKEVKERFGRTINLDEETT